MSTLQLPGILEGIWGLLEESVADRHNGFRTPALATLAPDSGCTVRTVVLRAVDRKRRCVRFYTDLRSPKARQIEADPRAALMFQDPARQVQLRAEAEASLHRADILAERCWATLPVGSRRDYSAAAAPGSPTPVAPNPLPNEESGVPGGRQNFAVADCTIARLDWLELDSDGHRRAVFSWTRNGELSANWVVP